MPTSYEIVVEASGFNRQTIEDITLAVRETLNLEVMLEESNFMGVIMVQELIETSGKPIINEQFLRRRPRQSGKY